MARNRGKRPGGASGSTSRSQNNADTAQAKAGETSAQKSQADDNKSATSAPAGASRAIAAKIDAPTATSGNPASSGSPPGKPGQSSPPAKSAASTTKPASSPSPSSAAPKAQASGRTAASTAATSTSGTPPSRPPGNGGGFWPGVAGGVIGGAATALAASFFWLSGDDGATAALESRLAAAEQQVGQLDALSERVAAVEAGPADAAAGDETLAERLGELETKLSALGEAPTGGADEGLGERLAALETQVQSLGNELQTASQAQATSAQTLSGLEGALPTLEATLAATGETVEATDAKATELGTRIETLGGDIQALTTRMGETESRLDHLGGEYQRGAAMIVAIGDIDRAISKSEPFASPLESLKSLVRDDTTLGETLTGLEPMAADGVPSVSELRSEFGSVASRVLLAEKGDRSLADQVSDNVFGIINMRPSGTEVEGSDSRAVLSRAQAKLSGNDLEGAVAELANLDGAAAEAASAWVERAGARLSAEAAVVDLRSHAQGLVAKGS